MLKNENWWKNLLTSLEPRSEIRITLFLNTVFNEMWFLTVDPLARVSFSFAKLSERQDCWRILEDFHSQEYIQFFDVHCCFFMRLHFSIGGYDYRRTAQFRQSIHLFQHHSSLFC